MTTRFKLTAAYIFMMLAVSVGLAPFDLPILSQNCAYGQTIPPTGPEPGDPALDDHKNDGEDAPGENTDDDEEGDPVDLSHGSFLYAAEGLEFGGGHGDLRLGFSYNSSALGYRSRVNGRLWTHNFEQEIVLKVRRQVISVPAYSGPVSVFGVKKGEEGGASGKEEEGDEDIISSTVYRWVAYHYHDLRIDRYSNHTSSDNPALDGTEVFLCDDSRSRILPDSELRLDRVPTIMELLPHTLSLRKEDGTIFKFQRNAALTEDPHEWDFHAGWEGVAYSLVEIIATNGQKTVLSYENGLLGNLLGDPGLGTPASIRKPMKLSRVATDMGGYLDFAYTSPFVSGLLRTVTDHNGRQLVIDRNSTDDVEYIERPTIFTGPDNYDMNPGLTPIHRRRVKFTYVNGSSLIESISAPNEVAINSSNPTPYVTNKYHARKVVRQTYGGVNESGIPCGGMYSFLYEDVFNDFSTTAGFISVRRVLTIDPSGSVKLVYRDSAGRPRLSYAFEGQSDHPDISQFPNGWYIPDHVSVDPNQYPSGGHLVNGSGSVSSNVDMQGNVASWTKVTRRTFDEKGNVIRVDKDGVVFEHTYANNRRVGTKRTENGVTRILGITAYEPLFKGVAVAFDSRGQAAHSPPNGSSQWSQWMRYSSSRVFDYQEFSLSEVESHLDAAGATLSDWALSISDFLVDQNAALSAMGGPTTVPFAFGLSDVNGDGVQGPIWGNVILNKTRANVFQDASQATTTPTYIPHEYVTTTQYNDHGQVAATIDSGGLVTAYMYYPKQGDPLDDSSTATQFEGGALGAMVVGLGNTLEKRDEFEYDDRGNLALRRNSFGAETELFYDEAGRTIATHQMDGAIDLRGYDKNGNVVRLRTINSVPTWSVSTPSDVAAPTSQDMEVRYAYDLLNYKLKEIVPYLENGNVKEAKTLYRYDRSRRLVLKLLPEWSSSGSIGNVESAVLDEWGRVHEHSIGGITPEFVGRIANADIPELLSGSIQILGSSDDGLSQETTYYRKGRIALQVDAMGLHRSSTYNDEGLLVKLTAPSGAYEETEYDLGGLAIRKAVVNTDGKTMNEKRFTLDEMGRVMQVDHRILRSATDVLDPIGLVDGPLTPNDDLITSRIEFSASGLRSKSVTDNGQFSLYEHNVFGRITKATDPAGNEQSFEYDKAGNLVVETSHQISELVSEPDLHLKTWRVFSKSGRILAEVENSGVSASEGYARRYVYDAIGNMVFTSDAKGGGAASTPFSSLDLEGTSSVGGAPSLINSHGNQTVFHWDARGFRIRTERFLREGGVGSGVLSPTPRHKSVTLTDYNSNGNLQRETDSNGNATEYTYDKIGRPTGLIYADGSVHTKVLDALGRPKSETDANGTTKTYTYGTNGLVERKQIDAPSGNIGGASLFTYGWDGGGRIAEAISTSASSGSTTVSRRYNSLGGIVYEEVNGVETSAEFDSMGEIVSTVYPWNPLVQSQGPSSRVVKWVRNDPLNRVSSVEYDGSGGQPLAEYSYLGNNRTQRVILGNGVEHEIRFDLTGKTHSTIARKPSSPRLLDLEYGWDEAGYRTNRENHNSSIAFARSLEYNSLGQMTSSQRLAIGGGVEETVDYGLDLVGNRETVTGGASPGVFGMIPIDMAVNAYTTTPGMSMTYDENGNLINQTSTILTNERSFQYDSDNQVVRIEDTDSGQIVNFVYGPFGRRMSKSITNGTTTEWVAYRYLVTGALAHEVRSTGGVTGPMTEYKEYVYGLSSLTPFLVEDCSGTPYSNYLHADDMGNVLSVTDQSGVELEVFDYTDYGVVRDPLDWTSKDASGTGLNFLYAGKYYDWETGLYDSRARMYDPLLGRFTSRDPLGVWADSANLGNGYTYAGNNPWTLSDPTGLTTVMWVPDQGGQNDGAGTEGQARADSTVQWVKFTYNEFGEQKDFEECDTTYIDENGNIMANGADIRDLARTRVAHENAKSDKYDGRQWDDMPYDEQVEVLFDMHRETEEAILALKDKGLSYGALEKALVHLEGAQMKILKGALADAIKGGHPFEADDIKDLLVTTSMRQMGIGKNTAQKATFGLSMISGGGAAKASKKASRAGKKAYKLGKKGEDTVAKLLDIEKHTSKIPINGRNRIPDFVTDIKLIEVKNTKKQGWTKQLQDYYDIAHEQEKKLDLYVRKGLRESGNLSGRLLQAEKDGKVNIIGVVFQ